MKKKIIKKAPKISGQALVLDLLKEVRDDQKLTHEALAGLDIKLVKIEHNVEKNTEDLTEHIEGVLQNRVRIEKVENFCNDLRSEERGKGKVLKISGVIVGMLVGIASIIYNIITFFRS